MARPTDTEHRLTPAELAAWAGFLRVHGAINQALDADLSSHHDISLSDYDVLVFLANAPQRRMRMSELADSVLITQSGITRLVDRLVARGFIERVRCPEDRRGAFAALTRRGLKKLTEAAGTHLTGVRGRFLAHLSAEEQAALAEAWERILPDVAETFRRLSPPG